MAAFKINIEIIGEVDIDSFESLKTIVAALTPPKPVENTTVQSNPDTVYKAANALVACGFSKEDAHCAVNSMQLAGIRFLEKDKANG